MPFLFLTSYSDKDTLQRAKAVNPSGYIVRSSNKKALLASLEIAISNHALDINRDLPALSLDKINRHLLSILSEREFEIAQLVYDSMTNTQIAEHFYISINTIKMHLISIHLKLEAASRL